MKIELRNEELSVVRDRGFVPGVVYGHKIQPTNIQVNYKDLMNAYHDNGLSMSFGVTLDNKKHVVFFKEIQKDTMNRNDILHFDLMKVSSKDIMTAAIPVHVKGREIIENKGLIVQVLSSTLDFEFPVSKGISSVEVDISALEDGDSILASAIEAPKGFVLHGDPTRIVLSITHPRVEVEADEEATTEEETKETVEVKE